MTYKRQYLYLLCVPFALMACTHSVQDSKCGTGETIYIGSFPSSSTIELVERFKCDEIGLSSIKVVDSLLIIGKRSGWSIVSPDGRLKYGDCLSTGQGPGEFTYIPRVSVCHFFHNDDTLMVRMPDNINHRLLDFNVSRFITDGVQSIKPAIESPELNNSNWVVLPFDNDVTMLLNPNENFTGFSHSLLKGDSLHYCSATKKLDEMTVDTEADINLLAKVPRYNAHAGKIVEVMLYLNQINIISSDGLDGITICYGNKIEDLKDIAALPRYDRLNTYTSVSAWDYGFGAVYIGETDKDLHTKESISSMIQFFDWDGNPITEVTIPYQVSAFDIDFENALIYIINASEDILLAYDATEIVNRYSNRIFYTT